jgi:hypothetical protein
VVLNPPVSFGEVMMDPFKEYVPKAKQVTVRLTEVAPSVWTVWRLS